MFHLNTTPGLYELVDCGDGAAGTLLAALIGRQVERVCWITSPATYAPAIFGAVAWQPHMLFQGSQVAYAFEVAKAISSEADLIVIDSLAELRGMHPESKTISAAVKRAVMGWDPAIPILVTNHWRHPAPPGGVYWRGRANSRCVIPLREQPLIALLEDFQEGHAPLFLVWYPNYRPEFRPLKNVEWSYFFPDGVPGYRVFTSPGQPVTVHSIAQKVQRRPWLPTERKAAQ